MTKPPATQQVAVEPHAQRRGCSCVGTLLFLAAFILVAALLAYMVAEQYTRSQALKGMSPAQVTGFSEWLYKPVDVPVDWLRVRPSLPEYLAVDRNRFFDDIEPLRRSVQRFFFPRATTSATSIAQFKATVQPSLYEKLVNGLPLNDVETSAVLGYTLSLQPLANRAQDLTAHSDYRINDRGLFDRHITHWPAATAEVFSPYILGYAYAGDWNRAISAHAAVGKLVRRDPEFIIHYQFADEFLRTSEALSRYTSDTAQLKQLLQVMIDSRPFVLQPPVPLDHPLSGFYKIGREMAEDGFIRQAPATRMEYYRVWLLYPDYLKWLTRRPASDNGNSKQAPDLDSFDDDYGYILPFHDVLRPINIGILRPLVRHVSLGLGTAGIVANHSESNATNDHRNRTRTEYDLFCLHLVQRIATLDGHSLPTTPEEFVPAYLAEFPADPFTSAPMQLDSSTKRFYSVGADKLPTTADDIVSQVEDYDEVDKENGYR